MLKKLLLATLIGAILTAVFLWPLIVGAKNQLASYQDGILAAWLIDQGSRSIIGGTNFFDPPFFYPYRNTAAYSDLFFSTALFNVPLILVGSTNFVFNNNLHLIVGSILIFVGHFYFAQELFKKNTLALLSASIFTFSHFHLDYLAHPHVFLLAGLPWGSYFWLRFLKTSKQLCLLGLTSAGLYQFLNSPLSGYFFFLIIALITLFYFKDLKRIPKLWQKLLPWALGSIMVIGFFYWPYLQISQEFQFTRSIRDAAHFAFGLEKIAEPELIFWLLVIGALFFTKNTKTNQKKIFLALSLTIMGGFLMLGPALKINGDTIKIWGLPIPLPYSIFYYLVPGFKAFRASSRFIVIMVFGLSLLIPTLAQSNNWLKKQNRQIVFFFLTLTIIFVFRFPKQKTYRIPLEILPIYEQIAKQPESVLAEFPTYVWSQFDQYHHEATRLINQNFHQKKLYNGFSGFAPPTLENRWHTINDQLDEPETINHLKKSGVELVLIHFDEMEPGFTLTNNHYQLIQCHNQSCLYHLN